MRTLRFRGTTPCLAAMLFAASLGSAAGSGVTWSSPAEAESLHAALLFNFVKFVEWPPEVLGGGAAITVCVVEHAAVAEALERTAAGRNIEGHPVRVVRATADDPLRGCHVVDASGMEAQRAMRLLQLLRDAPILTIGDAERFAARGGVMQLFVENNQMRFGVNVSAAQHAGLHMSSKLLSLARLIDKE